MEPVGKLLNRSFLLLRRRAKLRRRPGAVLFLCLGLRRVPVGGNSRKPYLQDPKMCLSQQSMAWLRSPFVELCLSIVLVVAI